MRNLMDYLGYMYHKFNCICTIHRWSHGERRWPEGSIQIRKCIDCRFRQTQNPRSGTWLNWPGYG